MSSIAAIDLNDLQQDPSYLTGQAQPGQVVHVHKKDVEPCINCQHTRECTTGQQACQPFCNYVQGREWKGMKRQPSSFFYERLNWKN